MWHLEPDVIFQLRQNHAKSDFFCPKNKKQLVIGCFIFVTGNSPLHCIVSADFRNCMYRNRIYNCKKNFSFRWKDYRPIVPNEYVQFLLYLIDIEYRPNVNNRSICNFFILLDWHRKEYHPTVNNRCMWHFYMQFAVPVSE